MRAIPYNLAAVPAIARLCLLALLVASAALPPASAQAGQETPKKYPTLEQAMEGEAPAILDALKKWKGSEPSLNVGVLKFRVQVGQSPASDNAGPLNSQMASRLEAALILALQDKDQIRILHNPSAVVWRNGNARANYDTLQGRKAFFNGYRYPPAWGREDRLPAHLFLTGLVKIDDAAKTATACVRAFDRTGAAPKQLCAFETIADPRLLTEAGVCFALPRGGNLQGVKDMRVVWEKQTVKTGLPGGYQPVPPSPGSSEESNVPPAESIKKTSGEQSSPSAGNVSDKMKKGAMVRKILEEAPIQFDILYEDGENVQRVKVRADGTVPEPPAGTKVKFRLSHKNNDDYTYGVVLKVNGENTLFPQERETDDFAYRKWILKPKSDFTIQGYQLSDTKAREFKTLTSSESRRVEEVYGKNAGMFTMVVFQERRDGGESQLVRLMNGNDVPAISRGVPAVPAEERNDTLNALKKQLKAAGQEQPDPGRGRGIVVKGKSTKQEVEMIPFKGYPIPVSVIQIRYYKPQNQEK